MDNSEQAIVKTLLYSDVFEYPLDRNQIWKYLISDKKIDKNNFDKKLDKINTVVHRNKNFFFIKDKNSSVLKRFKKEKESYKKIKKALTTIKVLSKIPTVKLIGISGNLSLLNAGRKDDIDLFIVSSKNTAWSTRLLLILLLKLLGKHRKREDREVSDKFCLNMIIDEEKLSQPGSLRNLYTAHEIAQLLPIFEREDTFGKFADSNQWMVKYLPNSISEMKKNKIEGDISSNWEKLAVKILEVSRFEKIAMIFQKALISRNLTREIVQDKYIALHPRDYGALIIKNYSSRLTHHGL